MPLQLYNTLTRKKSVFTPLDPENIRLYVCGPTVYDYAHIGNARPVIVFDVLARLLRQIFGTDHVTYVRNITDVDDKIIQAHQETGQPIAIITARTTQAFHDDMADLNNLPPDVEPRATEHIPEMIMLIQKLISTEHAYEKDGNVLFNVKSMPDYGKLSRRNRDQLIAGARVDVAPYKQDPADFVLWKPSSEGQPGWDSPWGNGRPGWHIECSAMSQKYLTESFDIHGGGVDLVFPHHENEIAQSLCAHGPGTFAQTWMHNGYLMVEGEKMSKSLGNFITVRDLLNDHQGETIRLCMLMTHYRQPLNWTTAGLVQARDALDKWYGAVRSTPYSSTGHIQSNMADALADDLNTPLAIATLHEMAANVNRSSDPEQAANLVASANLMGLLQHDPEAWFKIRHGDSINRLGDAEINDLIAERDQARASKNFARSDDIRNQLAESGILLEDGTGGTTWKRA